MGYEIKNLRLKKRISQEELAEQSGVSRAIISRLESGAQTDAKASTLKKIATVLDCTISELLND